MISGYLDSPINCQRHLFLGAPLKKRATSGTGRRRKDSSLNAAAMLELGHTLQRLVAPNDPVPLARRVEPGGEIIPEDGVVR